MKIGKIIAIIISSLVSLIFLVLFGFMIYMSFSDISIRNNILLFIIVIIISAVPLFNSINYFNLMLKGKMKVLTTIILEIVLVPLSIIFLVISMLFIGFLEVLFPVKNYHQYKNLYKANSDSALIQDFPSNVPKNAKDIKFFYMPGILQGLTAMNLYYRTDAETIEKYKSKYEKLKIDINSENAICNVGSLYLDDIYVNGNYRQYYLYSSRGKQGDCNHGSYSIVSINDVTNECIFEFYEW